MLLFEMKKIFSKPINKIALLILIALPVISSFLAIRDVHYVDENGNTTIGIMASSNLKNAKNQWAGYLTEDVLSKVVEENKEIITSEEYLSENAEENEKAYSKTQGFSDIKQMMNLAFSGFQEYDYFRADSVTAQEAGTIYERRIENLKEWLNSEEMKDNYSEKEKQFLVGQYEKLDTPFYYEYAEGWKALLDSAYTPTIMLVLAVIIGLLVSGIFSEEFQLKADSIFFSTKLGRGKAVRSKMAAGFLVVTLLYWCVILLYSAIILGVLGFGGGKCPIQTGLGAWDSFYNVTYLQHYLLTIAGGYLGSLFIATFSMFVSAKSHSTILALTIPFVLLCVTPFLGRIPILSPILKFFPDQLLQICETIKHLNVYQIGGKVMGAIPITITLYILLYIILLPILHRVYRKAQIK